MEISTQSSTASIKTRVKKIVLIVTTIKVVMLVIVALHKCKENETTRKLTGQCQRQ